MSRVVGSVCIAALLAGCSSTSSAPASLSPANCTPDPRLAGTWRSVRETQVGRATLSFTFHCDCRYDSHARVMLSNIRERGAWWVDGGRISFSRGNGTTTSWSFRFDGEKLVLEEGDEEEHVYERMASERCPSPVSKS